MAIPWNDDPPGAASQIQDNLERLLRQLVTKADDRVPPSVELAKSWHRTVFTNVPLPVPYYAGEIRDDDPRFPQLVDYEVRVGPWPGVPAREVPAQLDRFERRIQSAVRQLDLGIPPGEVPRDAGVLSSVVTLCAYAHGDWARIQPFANGNGRIARLWANWCALRYGLPPFVRLRPRPAGLRYTRAAADSMRGDHRATLALFADWIAERLTQGG